MNNLRSSLDINDAGVSVALAIYNRVSSSIFVSRSFRQCLFFIPFRLCFVLFPPLPCHSCRMKRAPPPAMICMSCHATSFREKELLQDFLSLFPSLDYLVSLKFNLERCFLQFLVLLLCALLCNFLKPGNFRFKINHYDTTWLDMSNLSAAEKGSISKTSFSPIFCNRFE